MMTTMEYTGEPSAGAALRASFADFYRSEHEAMLRLAYLLCGSRAIAEELVHDSFARVQPRWGTLDAPSAYLRRTVTNACYSYLRRRKREQTTVIEAPEPSRAPEHDDVWDALARLKPRRRAVLVLRFYLDLSEADIARILGCRRGTVKSLSHRALDDLRNELE
jgi:RNA polymerase sigma-70 factor (sigma-E family)